MLKGVRLYLLLLACTYGIYYQRRMDAPVDDHDSYVTERSRLKDDVAWLAHSLDFNKTRLTYQGDYYLFRPAHFFILATADIFFRSNFYIIGGLGLCIFALAAWGLYAAIAPSLGGLAAFVISVFFISNLAGMEMVLWRHITPYILAPTLLLAGFARLQQPSERQGRGRTFLILALWTLSTLFHELAVLTLAFFNLLFLCAGRGLEPRAAERHRLRLLLVIPLLIYAALYALSFMLHPPPTLLGPMDVPPKSWLRALLICCATYLPSIGAGFFLPFWVDLKPGLESLRFSWNYYQLALAQKLIAILLLGGVCTLYARGPLRDSWRRGAAAFLAAAFPLLVLMVLFMGHGLGRGFLRTKLYMFSSTYYYSIYTFVLCLVVAGCLGFARCSVSPGVRVAGRLTLGLMAWLTCYNVMVIQRRLQVNAPRFEQQADFYRQVERRVRDDYGRRLGGVVPGSRLPVFGYTLAYFYPVIRCNPASEPLFLQLSGDTWFLSEIAGPAPALPRQPISFPKEPVHFRFAEHPNWARYADGGLSESAELLLSAGAYERPLFCVENEDLEHAGLVFNFKDNDNFSLIVIENAEVLLYEMQNGRLSNMLVVQQVASPHPRLWKIVHGADEGSVFVFVDGFLLLRHQSRQPTSGRLGFLSQKKPHAGFQSFKNPAAESRPFGVSIRFAPIAKLWE